MRLVIDMNLSPQWVDALQAEGLETVHWSNVGNHNDSDREILEWARENRYIVLTNDLDFGALLAETRLQGPSVIQFRTEDLAPESLRPRLTGLLREYASELNRGAIVSVEESRSRVRILPIY